MDRSVACPTIATATGQVGAYAQVHGTRDRPVEAEALAIMSKWCAALDQDQLTLAAVYNPDDDGGFTDTTLIERGDIVEIRIGYTFRLITGDLVIDGGEIPMAGTTRRIDLCRHRAQRLLQRGLFSGTYTNINAALTGNQEATASRLNTPPPYRGTISPRYGSRIRFGC